MEKQYIERLFDKTLDFYLKCVGAIQIVGPKFCGKSRTARQHANSVIDLMKESDKQKFIPLAKQSPDDLLDYGYKPLLIDEWQIIPYIWNSLKVKIDENSSFGQFILTGSVTDNKLSKTLAGEENEQHTGTGRIIKRLMRTMSLYESKDSNGKVSITDLKNNKFKPSLCNLNIHDYAYLVCRGGWPLSIDVNKTIALQQSKNFYDGLVNSDLYSLNDIKLKKDVVRSKKVLKAYARNISTEASTETIKKDIDSSGNDISIITLNKYLLALQRLFVIEELEAWNPNLRSKVAIREKNTRHFVDPSIATAALNITEENLFMDMSTFGLLFESMVVRDLRIYCDTINANVYHYRDKLAREADAVICFDDDNWALIEIKLADQEAIKEASKKLVKLSNDIDNKRHPKPAFLMIVTATQAAYKDENGVYIVPLGCLKN